MTGRTLGSNIVETFGYSSDRLQMTSQTATQNGNTWLSLTYSYQASSGQMGSGSTADNADQLMSVSGSIGGLTESASFTYDLQRRIVTSSQTTNGTSIQRRFAYDRWGNRTGVWDATSGGTQIQSVSLTQSLISGPKGDAATILGNLAENQKRAANPGELPDSTLPDGTTVPGSRLEWGRNNSQ